MKTDLKYFKTKDFHGALREFFKGLNIPVNYIAEEPARPQDILSKTYKEEKEAFLLMEDVYFLGMVDDAAFEGGPSLDYRKIESDYDGILIFGVTMHPRQNGPAPTRSQLAEITRAFNREFHYTPVVVVFRYGDSLAFANAERLPYKQEWREGEKAGKVSLLRDVDINKTHRGHLDILDRLAISRSGKQAVNSFAALYSYWQTVFNVALLNKKFYEELSNWYFWAVKEVTFPGAPTIHTLFAETGSTDDNKLQEARQEHNAKNVIRLLTRFLFVWFIKEKKLIPPELFDLDYVKDELVKDLSPCHQEGGLFQSLNKKSHYYKAILQNLFFATLNQEMGKRDFRKDKQHMNVTNLLRYESCFKNPQKFIELVEAVVPFMNGGLFECLDKPHPTEKGPQGGDVTVYEDGFSDRKDNPLVVPDYLFFGLAEEVDLSKVIGIVNKKTQQAAVKGLINIFESYKFTIAENTPIEEDIALDPELLGKVFENLLASYNPETKTTARKQTGSFYTPREIVNYMVDESLIAYLKNAVSDWGMEEEEVDGKLHQLLSFDPGNPFTGNATVEKAIIKALDNCAILDPACGSGAFPMGILQKMVHVLQKLDPDNTYWHNLQMGKALKETESAFHLVDKEAREQKLLEINEAFDEQINDPDYARKLFLIENCIYGVDIQPIAAQISKLRFFISLVVDQKVDKRKENFGIRPLPNLETKFVAANTLIGIEKPKQYSIGNQEIKELEAELKNVRHRIFSAKTPKTKRKLREEDQVLREKMGELLIADGWANKTAKQLAAWDPYDQNMSSPFFDPEWMFGMKDGFDVVIGNPPYVRADSSEEHSALCKAILDKGEYKTLWEKWDLYIAFIEKGYKLLKDGGITSMIVSDAYCHAKYAQKSQEWFLRNSKILRLDFFSQIKLFDAGVHNITYFFQKADGEHNKPERRVHAPVFGNVTCLATDEQRNLNCRAFFPEDSTTPVITINSNRLIDIFYISYGLRPSSDQKGSANKFITADLLSEVQDEIHSRPYVDGKHLARWLPATNVWIEWGTARAPAQFYRPTFDELYEVPEKILAQRSPGPDPKACYDNNRLIYTPSSVGFIPWHALSGVRNKSIQKTAKYRDEGPSKEGAPNREDLEAFSRKFSVKYVLAIMNSTMARNMLRQHRRSNIHLYPEDWKQLPIPDISTEAQKTFHTLVDCILIGKSNRNMKLQYANFEQLLDDLVLELYFPAHMKEKQIDILQFVEKDLAEIMKGRDFEQLPDSEKETVINQLHARWTHPDSEVRNRIKLFAVRSPDILKPILESR